MTIHKHIVRDENERPVAVQVDYATWLEIERVLNGNEVTAEKDVTPTDISDLIGTIHLTEDPLAFQRRIRDEW